MIRLTLEEQCNSHPLSGMHIEQHDRWLWRIHIEAKETLLEHMK